VLDHPNLVRGRSVLDLATGSGLVAIAAARAEAATVTATDIDRLALAAFNLNAEANGVRATGVLQDVLDGEAFPADVVLAGHVFYGNRWPIASWAFWDELVEWRRGSGGRPEPGLSSLSQL
jgi:predicted nicotinamide N-methyase